jgi:aminoglycoside phosphotransferase
MNLENLQESLPLNLRRSISGYTWRQNTIGFSSAQIFRLEAKDKTLYT